MRFTCRLQGVGSSSASLSAFLQRTVKKSGVNGYHHTREVRSPRRSAPDTGTIQVLQKPEGSKRVFRCPKYELVTDKGNASINVWKVFLKMRGCGFPQKGLSLMKPLLAVSK
ncbi:MAG: hypothetical protein KIH01_04165 [Candidatus Freyarchaeota archaeon]|nr:hypothetical protein [Candidatus Jordarchaeia archaeon]